MRTRPLSQRPSLELLARLPAAPGTHATDESWQGLPGSLQTFPLLLGPFSSGLKKNGDLSVVDLSSKWPPPFWARLVSLGPSTPSASGYCTRRPAVEEWSLRSRWSAPL